MRYALVGILVLVATVALAIMLAPRASDGPPCESGAWQEDFSKGDGFELVCMPVVRPRHDPLPSFSYSLDV